MSDVREIAVPRAPGPVVPKNAIVILLDSLNRRMLGAYGGAEFETPNIDRLASRSLVFERHYSGSLPCMPARHDILVGAMDFLWRPWGSIEVWEQSVVRSLIDADVATALFSDHPHLFETGGENYHTDFTAWDYQRGHESDPWKTTSDPSWAGAPALPAVSSPRKMFYDKSRTWFRSEEEFPGARTMQAAADWLDQCAARHDRFFVFVDEFDPHEPFDTPEPWASRYDPSWTDPRIIWPPYSTSTVANGVLTERQAQHVRANYGSKLSFIDHWLGKLLDVLDRRRMWDDTAVILLTDHGHYLGERDYFGKPGVPIFPEMGHIPLVVSWPGRVPTKVDALTASVDIHATICDIFDVSPGDHPTHGRSLLPLIEGRTSQIRDHLLCGIWGRHVQVVDAERMYARSGAGENYPLAMWSNRWSTMPAAGFKEARLPRPDRRAEIAYPPGTDVPVLRQPFQPGDMIPLWGWGATTDDHHLYDLNLDPGAEHNLTGTGKENEAVDLLVHALKEVNAPGEQFDRLGVA